MTGAELRNAIRALLTSHRDILEHGHTEHLEVYFASFDAIIALEPNLNGPPVLWVRSDSIRKNKLCDLSPEDSDADDFVGVSAGEMVEPDEIKDGSFFSDCDAVGYPITELWQAVRVILEVAGHGERR